MLLQRRYYLSAGMRKNSPFSGTAPSQSFGRVTQTCRRLPFHTVYGNSNEVWRIKSMVRCRPVTVILSVLQQSVSWLIRPTRAILCKVIAKIAHDREQERREIVRAVDSLRYIILLRYCVHANAFPHCCWLWSVSFLFCVYRLFSSVIIF